MRAHDWSASPLGWPETWPEALHRAVALILPSKFPMFIAWGPHLGLLYNEPASAVLGDRHPELLGQPLEEAWVRIWSTISPLVERVFAGEASFCEDLPLTILRFGHEQQAYFTFSFSPISDDSGNVAGLLAVVTETTSQVAKDQRLGFLIELGDRLRALTDPVEVAANAAAMLGRHLTAARAGYGEIDEAQEIVSVKQDWTDGTVMSLAGEARILDAFGPAVIDELRAGRTLVVEDCLADHRVEPSSVATWESIETRSLIVVPLVKEGRLRAVFYVHEPHARHWTDAEVALAQDVAERTWDAVARSHAEAALRESESQLRLAIDAGRMAVWEHDTATDGIRSTPELNRLLGYPPDARLDADEIRSRYYPGDRERLVAAAMETLDRGDRFFEVEYRQYKADGSLAWFLMRAEMILSPNGLPTRTVGVLLDITARKNAEEALKEREAELRAALDAGSLAIFDLNHATGEIKPSASLNELYGYPPHHRLTIDDIRARYHPDDLEQIWNRRHHDQNDGSLHHFDWTLRLQMPAGDTRWVNGRGEYLRHPDGHPVRSRGVVMDITERKRWEEHQQLLINELNHRVKNTLATVQSIASQTLRNTSTTEEARAALEARLFALSRAHDVLTRENWEGAGLKEIVTEALAPYRHERESRFDVEGPDVRLSPRMALAGAMALQELATNAVKYGALSNATGLIRIRWDINRTRGAKSLHLTWAESGGPPVETPTRRGFGSRLIERSLAQDLNGQVKVAFNPTGIVCTVDAPLG